VGKNMTKKCVLCKDRHSVLCFNAVQ